MSSKEKAFESLLEKTNKNMEKNHYGKTSTRNTKKAIFELDRDLFVELKVPPFCSFFEGCLETKGIGPSGLIPLVGEELKK